MIRNVGSGSTTAKSLNLILYYDSTNHEKTLAENLMVNLKLIGNKIFPGE